MKENNDFSIVCSEFISTTSNNNNYTYIDIFSRDTHC